MTIRTDVVIVGAGPCGLFQVFELGLLGLSAHVVDAMQAPGGQCAELYPDKPIYDIPAIPVCSAQELVDRLLTQIKPFDPVFHLDAQVTAVCQRDGRFLIATSQGEQFDAGAVVIAGGVGAFQPMPLRVAGIEDFVDRQVFYRIRNPARHHGKRLLVLGGGDSAFDWTVELAAQARGLTLVHRSDRFRAAPATVARMRELEAQGRVKFLVGNCVDFEADGDTLRSVDIRHTDRTVTRLEIDHALVFFGLSPKLGPISAWGLALDKNQIHTDTERFETNIPGIYAIGDIATYPGKKKLILSGFHEAALAAFAIKARLNPDEKVHLQYTTTSPIMHERLGV